MITRAVVGPLFVWVVAFVYTLTTYTFTDDHFDRISRARQIARYGELPFRDFFDPGYFLTEFLSAAVQRLAGDNLLGEMLLTSAFIATGAVVVMLLVRRVAPSAASAAVITVLVIVASPRPYDFDKFFFYPKAAVSYRVLRPFGGLDEIKLRGAFGQTGNQPLFGQKFTTLNAPQFGQTKGLTVNTTAGFAGIEPERLKEWEGGVDGAALDGRLTWDLTYFRRSTTNLLLTRTPAPSTGFSTQFFNGGEIENQGVEIGLGFTPIQNRNLQWVTRGTFTSTRSEVVDLAGLPPFRPPHNVASRSFPRWGGTLVSLRLDRSRQMRCALPSR